MTRDEIIAKWDGMAPRERDAWVEEVVFGGKVVAVADDDDFHVELPSAGGIMAYIILPYYTRDISASWTVLTHNGVYGEVSYMGDQCRAEVWARWNPETGVGEHEYAVSDSETEAICLAAIIANLTKEVA